jgi:hypothetical protein
MIEGSNDAVARYDLAPDAANYLAQNYLPTGNLRIPVVSVHNMFDPLVPFFHEAAYGSVANPSNLFYSTGSPSYGHCNFSQQDVTQSFQKLEDWVVHGTDPRT